MFDGSSITGAVDGGAGVDTYIRALTASGSVDLGTGLAGPTNFERLGFSAQGADITLTVSHAGGVYAGGVSFSGTGTIVNEAQIANSGIEPSFGQTRQNAAILGSAGTLAGSPLTFINRGTLGDGATGSVGRFENSGTIGSSQADGTILKLDADGMDAFALFNMGPILTTVTTDFTGNGFSPAVSIGQTFPGTLLSKAEIRNDNVIDGGLQASFAAGEIVFANSGTITSRSVAFPGGTTSISAVALNARGGFLGNVDRNTARLSFANSGRLNGRSDISGTIDDLFLTNTGQMGSLVIVGARHDTGDPARGLIGAIDQTRIAFDNSGVVSGPVEISGNSSQIDFINSGSIVPPTGPEIDANPVEITNDTLVDSAITFTNSGTISGNAPETSGIIIGARAVSAEAQQAGFDPLQRDLRRWRGHLEGRTERGRGIPSLAAGGCPPSDRGRKRDRHRGVFGWGLAVHRCRREP